MSRQPWGCVLLAAGVGSRLGNLGAETPKPLLPVAGKPVLLHHLEWCARHGIRRVFINTHHHARKVQAFARREAERLGMDIELSYEAELLGTAGALLNFKSALESSREPFVVIYADNYLAQDLDLGEMALAHAQSGAVATVALHWRDDVSMSGMVVLDAGGKHIVRIVEKPRPEERVSNLVNAGIYIVEPRIFALLRDGASDFARDVFPGVLAAGEPLGAFLLHGELLPIDTPELYQKALCKS